MALVNSTKIVTDNLVFYYDMVNGKSNIGAPVTNLLPGADINGLPTFGNSWATYNTNQYGSGTYFSIGSVASITSNIVTMTAAHGLRSYDVMQPQTTGGGVTGGTNYLIKRLSATTFSLHPYNGSQDGSQGYINPATGNHKVYDDFSNDVRIAINSSGFPTMWWGAPHLPNSGLVKEIISGGFNGIPGRAPTDCIRLHFNRPETDGMAYGVDAPVTAGVAHTVSFYTRAVTPSAVGQSISYQIYNYGVVAPTGYSFSATIGEVGVWTKQSMTFTPVNPTCISYFFPSTGNMKVDVSNIQFETGSVVSNFAPGTRNNTQAIVDLAGNNIITANSLTYDNDGTFSFNGNNYATISTFNNKPTTAITCEAWIYPSRSVGTGTIRGGVISSSNSMYLGIIDSTDGGSTFSLHWANQTSSSRTGPFVGSILNNAWSHIVGTYDGITARAYINGVEVWNTGQTGTIPDASYVLGTYAPVLLDGVHPFIGKISIAKIYNRGLSGQEVQQNFNALRGRYGI